MKHEHILHKYFQKYSCKKSTTTEVTLNTFLFSVYDIIKLIISIWEWCRVLNYNNRLLNCFCLKWILQNSITAGGDNQEALNHTQAEMCDLSAGNNSSSFFFLIFLFNSHRFV